MTEHECRSRIGEEKEHLLETFQTGVEIALARADFLNTNDMSTLQALVLYLVALRAEDSSRRFWALTALAIRIGQAMGLHDESTMSHLRPFDQQMRRRLWLQLMALDLHAADDRSTKPVILSADSYDTELPAQVNDIDMSPASVEIKESAGFTDMTTCLMVGVILEGLRSLNHYPIRNTMSEHDPQSLWTQRLDQAVKCQRHVEAMYLIRLNTLRPFEWGVRMIADIVLSCMWLQVYRPIQVHAGLAASLYAADPGILRIAVEVLEKSVQMTTDPATSSFKWLNRTFVQWHAIAVTVAELCVNTDGPLVERAWAVLDQTYDLAALLVADTHKGLLWRPIKKLMSRARLVREQHLSTLAARNVAQTATEDTSMSDQFALQSSLSAPVSHMPLTMDSTLPDPLVPFDWTPWMEATSNIAETATMDCQFTTDQMAWTNWTDFVDHIQGDGTMDSIPM